jgi:hypothetical protein
MSRTPNCGQWTRRENHLSGRTIRFEAILATEIGTPDPESFFNDISFKDVDIAGYRTYCMSDIPAWKEDFRSSMCLLDRRQYLT